MTQLQLGFAYKARKTESIPEEFVCSVASFLSTGMNGFFFSICFMDLLFFYLLTFGNKEYFMSVYLEHFKWIS